MQIEDDVRCDGELSVCVCGVCSFLRHFDNWLAI